MVCAVLESCSVYLLYSTVMLSCDSANVRLRDCTETLVNVIQSWGVPVSTWKQTRHLDMLDKWQLCGYLWIPRDAGRLLVRHEPHEVTLL